MASRVHINTYTLYYTRTDFIDLVENEKKLPYVRRMMPTRDKKSGRIKLKILKGTRRIPRRKNQISPNRACFRDSAMTFNEVYELRYKSSHSVVVTFYEISTSVKRDKSSIFSPFFFFFLIRASINTSTGVCSRRRGCNNIAHTYTRTNNNYLYRTCTVARVRALLADKAVRTLSVARDSPLPPTGHLN